MITPDDIYHKLVSQLELNSIESIILAIILIMLGIVILFLSLTGFISILETLKEKFKLDNIFVYLAITVFIIADIPGVIYSFGLVTLAFYGTWVVFNYIHKERALRKTHPENF